MFENIIRTIGFLIIVLLPGGWITFGLPNRDNSFWLKLILGAVISPIIAAIQFYILSGLGLSFGTTTLLICLINIPVFYLIYRERRSISGFNLKNSIIACLIFAAILIGFSPHLLDILTRSYSGHAWMHTEIIYMISNGQLIPEDPGLAGVRLAYPWAGHIHQALLAYTLGSPPVSNYIWINIIWMIFLYVITAKIVAVLGGGKIGQLLSVVWLFFGVNLVGYPIHVGDYRYTPWIINFFFFSQMPMALCMLTALVAVAVSRWKDGIAWSDSLIIFLLLLSIGLIYPIILLPACVFMSIWILGLILSGVKTPPIPMKQIITLGGILLISGLISIITYNFVTQERVISALYLSNRSMFLLKAYTGIVVTSPLLLAAVIVLIRRWKEQPNSIFILIASAMVSLFLYAVSDIRPVAEYKFVFTATIFLAPFPSLALDPLNEKMGRVTRVIAYSLLILFFMSPLFHKMLTDWPWDIQRERLPSLDFSEYDLMLAENERGASIFNTIREETPVDSIVIMDSEALNSPTLTQRAIYVHPTSEYFLGVNVPVDHLLTDIRGYDNNIIMERRDTIQGLYYPDSPAERERSIEQLLTLNRPLVLMIDVERHKQLLSWLEENGLGERIGQDEDTFVWLISPG